LYSHVYIKLFIEKKTPYEEAVCLISHLKPDSRGCCKTIH